MIFRAIFWIGLVALLMPHEPDLGFGRPGSGLDAAAGGNAGGAVADWAEAKLKPNLSDPENLCRYNQATCSAGASLIEDFREAALKSLRQVKADISRNAKTRDASGG
jgi:hypothetical protein